MQRIVVPRMPVAEDIQPVVVRTEPVQLLVDTVEVEVDIELAVDTVMAADIVEHQKVDTVLALEHVQDLERDTERVLLLRQRWDTGLVLDDCRKVVDSLELEQEQVISRAVASRNRVRQEPRVVSAVEEG